MTGPLAKTARAAALGAASALLAAPAAAGFLDQPPRLTTFKLDDPAAPGLPLLGAFQNAAIERPGPVRVYLTGAYGRWSQRPWWSLAWGGAPPYGPLVDDGAGDLALEGGPLPPAPLASPFAPPDETLVELSLEPAAVPTWLRRLDPAWSSPLPATTGSSFFSNGFDVLWEAPKKPVPNWRCRRRPVQFVRYGGESASFALVRCDGAVAPGALDRLSIMARPPEAPDPGELLPDEPDAEAWRALEWVPQVRVVSPRLLWLLQRVSDAFPWRTIYVFSGYRPKPADGAVRRGGHQSLHGEGRAVDIMVMGIPNAALFNFCRTLDDVGCGFYPNSKFVHVDVRKPGTDHAFWIDVSGPGEPSRYVDGWPGVVERGAMAWSDRASVAGSARGPETTTPPPP